jgi:hypothetical protein
MSEYKNVMYCSINFLKIVYNINERVVVSRAVSDWNITNKNIFAKISN